MIKIRYKMTFVHVTSLVLVSVPYDANDVVNGTIAFVRSR